MGLVRLVVVVLGMGVVEVARVRKMVATQNFMTTVD
jgi:hypothetical protein